MSMTVTVDMTGKLITAAVKPRMAYTPVTLRIKTHQHDVELLLDDEQLAEIGYAIQRYLDSIRCHETPDQDLIYRHELERSIEEVTV